MDVQWRSSLGIYISREELLAKLLGKSTFAQFVRTQ
jgi:hypothetical protein